MNHSRKLSVTLTVEQLEEAHKKGHLTVQGFLVLSVVAGVRLSDVQKGCEKLGISRASFFRAKAHLKKMQSSGSSSELFEEGSR